MRKRNKIFSILASLSVGVCALVGGVACGGGETSSSGEAPVNENEIILADFEEWAPDFQTLKISGEFGKVSQNGDTAFASGSYSAKIQPKGPYSSLSKPRLYMPTVSELFAYNYSDFGKIEKVTFTVYNAQTDVRTMSFGLVQNIKEYKSNALQGTKYLLQPGVNYVEYSIDDENVPYSADLNAIEGVYFEFDNIHSRELKDAPVFYLDDVKLITQDLPKIFIDEVGIGSCNKKFALPESKAYGAGENATLKKSLYFLDGDTKTEVTVSENSFIPTAMGEYEYCVSATNAEGKTGQTIKKIKVEAQPTYDVIESFSNTSGYSFGIMVGSDTVLVKSTVNTITVDGEEKTEVDGQSANGYMCKLALANVRDWVTGIYTRLAGAELDEAIAKFDYVTIRMYIDHGTNVVNGVGKTEVGFGKIVGKKVQHPDDFTSLIKPKDNGWYTVKIAKEQWNSDMQLIIRNGWGVNNSSFTVYLDEIRGGYTVSGRTFDSFDGDITNYAMHTNTNSIVRESSMVDTIDGASAEDLEKVQGSMWKTKVSKMNASYGVWSKLDQEEINSLADKYDYISLRFYLDIGTAKTVAISLYKVRANNTGIDSPASVYLSINKSGWIDLKIPAEEWIGRQVAFVTWGKDDSEFTVYFDELVGIKEDGVYETVNLVEKTGLTVQELAGTYFVDSKTGEKKVLSEEELKAFDLGGNGTLTLVITVDGYANTEMSFRIF